MEEKTTKTNRQLVTELLERVHPDIDVGDDETLFGIIYDDYEAYAALIESREQDIAQAQAEGEIKGRNARIEEIIESKTPASDGIPDLGGANTTYRRESYISIFDIARTAH